MCWQQFVTLWNEAMRPSGDCKQLLHNYIEIGLKTTVFVCAEECLAS
jgi:hypothetical protein